MTTAEIILSVLTFALVVVSGVYAGFTYRMMQTADRAEQFNRTPIIGIQIISVTPFDLKPSAPEPIVMFSVEVINLGSTPLFDIEVEGALCAGDYVDARLVFPKPIIPYLVKGGSKCVPLSFLGPFESIYQLAEEARIDVTISSDEEARPFVDFGRRYPIARATALFKNQMGDVACRSNEGWLYPSEDPAGSHTFMIVPIDTKTDEAPDDSGGSKGRKGEGDGV